MTPPPNPLLRPRTHARPDYADVHYALGLALIRLKRGDEAVAAFARASELHRAPPLRYVWALALQGVGQLDRALPRCSRPRGAQHPQSRDLLVALRQLSRDAAAHDAGAAPCADAVETFPRIPKRALLLGQLEADSRRWTEFPEIDWAPHCDPGRLASFPAQKPNSWQPGEPRSRTEGQSPSSRCHSSFAAIICRGVVSNGKTRIPVF